MEKDQLISMIHFLVKREEERAQENQEQKDMVRELRETRNSLMKSVDLLSKQLSDSSNEKAALLQKIDDLMSMISVNNKVRTLTEQRESMSARLCRFACKEYVTDDHRY